MSVTVALQLRGSSGGRVAAATLARNSLGLQLSRGLATLGVPRFIARPPIVSGLEVPEPGPEIPEGEPIKTAVYDRHVALQGRLTNFAGYALPLDYKRHGALTETLHTRSHSSLFDVSHMGQVTVRGPDAGAAVETFVGCSVANMDDNRARLGLILNDEGGIVDDSVITKLSSDAVGMVLNGACKAKDLEYMQAKLSASGLNATIEHHTDRSLFALQGPQTWKVIKSLCPEDDKLEEMLFMTHKTSELAGIPVSITRCGYTGEDGYEISMANEHALSVWDALIAHDLVAPAGLVARNSLRLEAGMCLYGKDIDENTTPVEAKLMWTIDKPRRARRDFPGAEVIMHKFENQADDEYVRCGLLVKGRPARDGIPLYMPGLDRAMLKAGPVGYITSGTYSPALKRGVSMAYLPRKIAKKGTKVYACIKHDRFVHCRVAPIPFVETRYYRGPDKHTNAARAKAAEEKAKADAAE